MLDFQPDLVISLGPNCRNAFNLRRCTGNDTAYPFDWWITPARSMLAMIQPEFRFDISPADLSIEQDGGTVLNRRLNLLHHHDFPRNRANGKRIESLDAAVIAQVNAKYRALFTRMHAEVATAAHPLFILNGLKPRLDDGLDRKVMDPALNRPCTDAEAAAAVQRAFGSKAFLVIIEAGSPAQTRSCAHGLRLHLPEEDDNEALPPGFGWAQPTGVFRRAYRALGLLAAEPAGRATTDAAEPAPGLASQGA